MESTPWQEIDPKAQFYLFAPRDEVGLEAFDSFTGIMQVFGLRSTGIKTHRDHFVIDFDREVLGRRIHTFLDPALPDEVVRQAFALKDNRDWKLSQKRGLIQQSAACEDKIVPCLYRPFDTRWIFYHYHAVDFGREEVMRHLLRDNLALMTCRQQSRVGFYHALALDEIAECCLVSNRTREIGHVLPLYLYPDTSKNDLFTDLEPGGEKKPNLNPKVVAALEEEWGASFQPHPRSPSPPAERGLGGEVARWRTPPQLWEILKPLARQMRRHPTPEEDKLWQQLRNRGLLGFKFRRQHPVDRFIVDFYSSKARLVVEVEGPIHQYTQDEDAVRREFLESLGLRVLRFTNDQVNNALDSVIEEIAAAFSEAERSFSPEDIFHYIYAVLYAPTYRQKYAEFLKIDFPRIPFTADFELFQALAALGKRLVELHLLRSGELDPPAARFQGQGDNRVARTRAKGFRYEAGEERVYVNKTQYFEPVPLELWEYQIGGYQVLSKWLKDRRDRRLTLEEIKTYCRVVTAIQKTIALQVEIDALYPQAEAEIVRV